MESYYVTRELHILQKLSFDIKIKYKNYREKLGPEMKNIKIDLRRRKLENKKEKTKLSTLSSIRICSHKIVG